MDLVIALTVVNTLKRRTINNMFLQIKEHSATCRIASRTEPESKEICTLVAELWDTEGTGE